MKGYKDKEHKLNCSKFSLKYKSVTKGNSDITSSFSLSKKTTKGGSGINRPEGFSLENKSGGKY